MVDDADRIASVLWAIVGVLVTAVAELAGHPSLLGPVPWWMRAATPAVFGGLAALSTITPRRRNAPEAGQVRAVSWAAAGLWVAAGWQWGLTGRYWQVRTWRAETWWPQYWLAGLLLAVLAVVAAAAYAMPTDMGELDAAGRPKAGPPPGDPVATEWAARLARICKIQGAQVNPVTPWPSGNGYDVTGELPDDGSTWADLKPHESKLRATLKLRGGSVEVGPVQGGHDGEFLVRVATVDALAEDHTYVDLFGTGPLSINGAHPVARLSDGALLEVEPRGRCGMCVSHTGGGKTNYLHTLTANYVRCDDALVWHIDLGGAGLALPWVLPYLDAPVRAGGVLDGCPIDWVAADEAEALLMTTFALQVIKRRRAAYQRLMQQANTDLLPCSPQLPGIRIVMDETAEGAGTTANPRLAANIVRIVQLGRAVEVRIDFSALSATASVLPREAQKQIGARAVFGVNDEAEVGYALGWHTKLKLADAGFPGAGWIRRTIADEIRRARPPHTSPPRILTAISRDCEGRRPVLDEPSAQVPLRDAYLSRWARAVPVLSGGHEPAHEPAHQGARAVSVSRPSEPAQGAPSGLDAALARARHVIAGDRVKGAPPGRVDAEFERLAGQLADDRAAGGEGWAAEDGDGRVEPRQRMAEMLDAAGPSGTSGPKLLDALTAEGYRVSKASLYEWLRADAKDGGYGVWLHPKYGQGLR